MLNIYMEIYIVLYEVVEGFKNKGKPFLFLLVLVALKRAD